MPNLKSLINSHNKTIIHNTTENQIEERKCNCVNKTKCPLNQECLATNCLYKATIKSRNESGIKIYFGISSTKFKSRYANHIKSFRTEKYKTETELSNEFWRIKEKGETPVVTWEIVQRYPTYNPTSKKCLLCLNEKLTIATYGEGNMLNKRTELISKCRHQNRFLLSKFDSKD